MTKTQPIIETVAGNTSLGDGGPAISAWLWDPVGIAVDSAGDLYIADRGRRDCILKVDASTGNISTSARAEGVQRPVRTAHPQEPSQGAWQHVP